MQQWWFTDPVALTAFGECLVQAIAQAHMVQETAKRHIPLKLLQRDSKTKVPQMTQTLPAVERGRHATVALDKTLFIALLLGECLILGVHLQPNSPLTRINRAVHHSPKALPRGPSIWTKDKIAPEVLPGCWKRPGSPLLRLTRPLI